MCRCTRGEDERLAEEKDDGGRMKEDKKGGYKKGGYKKGGYKKGVTRKGGCPWSKHNRRPVTRRPPVRSSLRSFVRSWGDSHRHNWRVQVTDRWSQDWCAGHWSTVGLVTGDRAEVIVKVRPSVDTEC